VLCYDGVMPIKQQAAFANHEHLRVGSCLVWTLIGVMAVTGAAACWAAHLSIDCQALPIPIAVVGISAPVALFYRTLRPDPAIFYATQSVAQIFLISLLGAILAYGAAASGLPYRDAELFGLDRWLGFDPRVYLEFVAGSRWLAALYPLVYLSMVYQPAVVFVALMLTRRLDRLHDFAIALGVSLVITIAVFALFPAVGWYAYLGIDPAAYPRLQLFWNFAEHLENVRSGALHAVPLADLRGIISFPSYHTAAAVLAIWAVWPIRLARWPMLILNALMVAAAPVEGAHYLVDLVGGAAVGACSVAAAALVRRAICRHLAERGRSGPTKSLVPVLSR
jgi:membrane-associated phospholipid phosphatase